MNTVLNLGFHKSSEFLDCYNNYQVFKEDLQCEVRYK
jgi:hypothetical protein